MKEKQKQAAACEVHVAQRGINWWVCVKGCYWCILCRLCEQVQALFVIILSPYWDLWDATHTEICIETTEAQQMREMEGGIESKESKEQPDSAGD